MADNLLSLVVRATDESSKPVLETARAYEKFAKDTGAAAKKAQEQTADATTNIKDAWDDLRESLSSTTAFTVGALTVGFGQLVDAAKATAAAIKNAIAFAVGGTMDLARQAADAGDAAYTSAQRLGVSAEFVTQLGYAAKTTGTDLAAFEEGIKSLAKASVNNGESFRRWGVSLKDQSGNLKSTERLFLDAAEAISRIENPAERAAAAQAMFGRSALQLIPLLSEGREGFKALAAEADKYGATISGEAARAGDAMNDAIERMQSAIGALGREWGDTFVPAITEGANALADLAASAREFVREAKGDLGNTVKDLATIFRGMTTVAGFIAENFDKVTAGAKVMAKALADATPVTAGLRFASEGLEGRLRELAGVVRLLDIAEQDENETKKKTQEAIDTAITARQKEMDEIRALYGDFLRDQKAKREAAIKEREQEAKAEAKREQREFEEWKKTFPERIREREQQIVEGQIQIEEARKDIIDQARLAELNAETEKATFWTQLQLDEAKKAATERDKQAKEAAREMERFQAQSLQAATSLYNGFHSAFAGILAGTRSLGDAMLSIIAKVAESVVSSFAIKGLASLIGGIVGGPAGVKTGGLLTTVLGFRDGGYVSPGLQRFASGGMVDGPSGDDAILARVTKGEYVLPPWLVEDIQRGRPPTKPGHFASGGYVNGQSAPSGAPQQVVIISPTPAQLRRTLRDRVNPQQKMLARYGVK